MLVSREKRKTNIVEYILYLWQIEDLIRALELDMDKITSSLAGAYQVDDTIREEIVAWYQNLVLMMQKEQKQQGGHLQFLVNLTDDLNRFHLALIDQQTDPEYTRLYSNIQPDIELVRNKSGQQHHDVEVVLNSLYIILMLKMKQHEVSEGTQQAVWKFGHFMGYLAKLYKAYESGDLEINF
ncbi:MAG: DUF4924 family protein [Prolixibacteraceae bacterium]|nr:DUF4924 family protein [Prolixibacteraceae bacterium]